MPNKNNPKEGTIAWELANLEDRCVRLATLLQDLQLSDDDRARLQKELETLQEIQAALAADMVKDRFGWLAWFWAEGSEELMRQVQKYPQ
jgi:hypothetical protein